MDRCILEGDAECDFDLETAPQRESMVTFFCGNALECRKHGADTNELRKISAYY